jgi:hypothetical protein
MDLLGSTKLYSHTQRPPVSEQIGWKEAGGSCTARLGWRVGGCGMLLLPVQVERGAGGCGRLHCQFELEGGGVSGGLCVWKGVVWHARHAPPSKPQLAPVDLHRRSYLRACQLGQSTRSGRQCTQCQRLLCNVDTESAGQ